MPKARTGNFTLRRIAKAVPADKAAHRFTALQRSGQYSELRLIQRGKSAFDIVGYKWPDKGVRRSLNIGRARKNPNQAGATTPNQVKFGSHGKTKVGWINRETRTRYQISYKVGTALRHVWRLKDKVKFVLTGRKGKIRNSCPKTANNPTTDALRASAMFHGLEPRHLKKQFYTWPKSLSAIGACVRLEYLSDKFDGKRRVYYHDFGKGARIAFDPKQQPNGDSLIIIRGPFKLKAEGITG